MNLKITLNSSKLLNLIFEEHLWSPNQWLGTVGPISSCVYHLFNLTYPDLFFLWKFFWQKLIWIIQHLLMMTAKLVLEWVPFTSTLKTAGLNSFFFGLDKYSDCYSNYQIWLDSLFFHHKINFFIWVLESIHWATRTP